MLTFALVMLMFNMLNNAIRRAQDESAASRRLLDVNTKVLSEVETQMASLLDVSASVNSASQSISDGAQRQASGIEEIAATLEEMGAAISRNADNAGSVNRMSEEALGLAEEGGSIVKRAVDSINEINVASGKIREITAVINDIAFQTNLLALNASVEAARAGEHGRGFAVVANEVRNLSLRSGASAKEIGGLIKDSIEKIDNGTQLVNTSGGALERIIESMKNVRPVVAEISAALDEQRRGMGQVNGAVSEIDALTQDNTRASEALTHSARSLNENAEQLKMLLDTTRA